VYAGILGAVIGLGFIGVWMRWWTRNTFATTPKGVLRHLAKTGSVHLKHVKSIEGIWNPSKPLGQDNRLFGPGEATYSFDDVATVTLEFRERNGHVKRYSGPVPEPLTHPTEEVLRARKLLRYVLVGYVALMIIGFAIGYGVAGGSALHRLIVGGIGLLIAMILVWFVALVLRVGLSVRSLVKGRK
jgi:hypothetical protein